MRDGEGAGGTRKVHIESTARTMITRPGSLASSVATTLLHPITCTASVRQGGCSARNVYPRRHTAALAARSSRCGFAHRTAAQRLVRAVRDGWCWGRWYLPMPVLHPVTTKVRLDAIAAALDPYAQAYYTQERDSAPRQKLFQKRLRRWTLPRRPTRSRRI